MTTRKAKTNTQTITLDAETLNRMIAEAVAVAVDLARVENVVPSTKAKGKAKAEPQTDAQKKAANIRAFVDSVKDLSLAQLCKRIAPVGTANRKAKTFVNDWAADKVPTAETLKYFPITHRSAFKHAWKQAQKNGTIKTRAQALEMLEKAM